MARKSPLKPRSPASLNALRRFEKAVIELSWKGSRHPEDWDAIQDEYQAAKENIKKYLPEKLLSTTMPKDFVNGR